MFHDKTTHEAVVCLRPYPVVSYFIIYWKILVVGKLVLLLFRSNISNNRNYTSFETSTSASKDTETALDRITNKYKELTDVIGSNVNLILSQIKLLETQGKEVGEAYYTELVDQSSTKIAILTEQFNELRQQFLNTPKGTDEWLELNSAILEVQNSIFDVQ